MRDKGIISQAEYDSAVHDLKESVGEHAPKEGTAVLGKWSTTFYGFLEGDNIWDTTRSLNDLSGNAQIARSIASGDHRRRTCPVYVGHSQLAHWIQAPRAGDPRDSRERDDRDGLSGAGAHDSESGSSPSPNPVRYGGEFLREPNLARSVTST